MVPLVGPGDSWQAGDVHGERASKGDVQRLSPTANGKQGLIGLYRSLQKHHFESIALRAECAARVIAVVAPQLWRHVRSAGQADSIRPLDILVDQRLILGKVHHDGQAARLENGVDIAFGGRFVLGKLLLPIHLAGLESRGDKDERTRGGLLAVNWAIRIAGIARNASPHCLVPLNAV